MTFPMPIHTKTVSTPLGSMLLAASRQGLVGAWFMQGQKHLPDAAQMAAWPVALKSDTANLLLNKTAQQLEAYFLGKRKAFDVPLDLSSGTAFQQSVWREISRVACGATNSYGAIGKTLGNPQAARAVGAAVGKNPISIIVPCHRIVGSAGAMTGYAGGLERKIALLQLEAALI